MARAEAEVAAARTRAEVKAARRAAKEEAAAARGQRPKGRQPAPDQELERPEARLQTARATAAAAELAKAPLANTTDPDSRIMKTPGGCIQGYNTQAAVNEGLVVVACTVTQEANDFHQLLPMMAATQATLAAAAVEGEIGLVLADAGSWSEDNATAEGPDRLIATTKD